MHKYILHTVGGESYVWEKFHEFREFSHSHETFLPVHTEINSALLESQKFSTGMQSSTIRETFPACNFLHLQYTSIHMCTHTHTHTHTHARTRTHTHTHTHT